MTAAGHSVLEVGLKQRIRVERPIAAYFSLLLRNLQRDTSRGAMLHRTSFNAMVQEWTRA